MLQFLPVPKKYLKIEGNTKQTTYTGKNLFSGDFSQFNSTGGEGSTYAYFKLPDETKTYTLTLIAKNDFTGTSNTYLGFTTNGGNSSDAFKWAISGESQGTITKGTVISINSISNNNLKMKAVSLYAKTEATLKIFTDNFDIQLEEGSTATTYEPYVGGTASPNPDYPQTIENVIGNVNITITNSDSTEEQTFTFPLEEGQRLYLEDYLSDDGIHHTKAQKILNGTEEWSISDSEINNNKGFIREDDTVALNTLNEIIVISNYFKGDTPSNIIDVGNVGISSRRGTTARGFYIRIPKTIASTVTEFKSWLSEHPVTVEYEQATEVVEPYTTEQQKVYNNIQNYIKYEENPTATSTNVPPPIFTVIDI